MGLAASSRAARSTTWPVAASVLCAALLAVAQLRRRALPPGGSQQGGNASERSSPGGQQQQADAASSAVAEEEKARRTQLQELRRWAASLVQAAANGEQDVVQDLLVQVLPFANSEAGYLNTEAELPASGWTGITAAGAAALRGHSEVLATLLEARANPDIKCQHSSCWDGAITITLRDTALCMAAKHGHTSCVSELLAVGADPNISCDSEFLEGAVEWGEEDDGTEMTLYSALDMADQAGHLDISKLLQASGGVKIALPASARAPQKRKMISSGSRMGA
ncbi:unnamed protein product [Polarella glacialis]|uniref:Uncharacterized protein n=1 Tax=Polarella glacialis TaxID=89957 RepID=A0A813KVD1_POLGL|nr:unnamed protein product [Polarella glacialis]CAE8714128.1 unnamed protein product [Polarella glacialis]